MAKTQIEIEIDLRELSDFVDRIDAARRRARYEIGDATWADEILDAFINPETVDQHGAKVDPPFRANWDGEPATPPGNDERSGFTLMSGGDDFILRVSPEGVVSLGRDVLVVRVGDELKLTSPHISGAAILNRETVAYGEGYGPIHLMDVVAPRAV